MPAATSRGRVRRNRIALVSSCALVVLALLLHARGLDEFFYKDDFELLRRARDGTLAELVTTRLVDHFEAENEWGHWRPGWWVVNDLAQRAFGLDPFGYRLAIVLVHAGLGLCAQFVAARSTGRASLGFLAGLLFVATPATVEGVAWIAAATNVLPAAALVGGSGIAWFVHLRSRSAPAAAVAYVLGASSLFFREAAYHLPLLFFFGWLVVRGLPRGRREVVRLALPVLAALALVALHYARLVRCPQPIPPPAEWAARTFGNLGECARLFAPFEVAGLPWLALVAGALAALFALGRRSTRYFLAWALLATFPYVATQGYASRFAYFPAFPLAIGLALGVHALGDRLGKATGTLATAALATFAALGVYRFPATLEPYLENARTCRRFVDACTEQGVARYERVCVDTLPWELVNGTEALFELFLGKPIELVHAGLAFRPPFAVHLRPIPAETPEQGFLTVAKNGRARLCGRAELLRGAVPVPAVACLRSWRVVEDPQAALALVRAGAVDPASEALLCQPLSHPPDPRAAEATVRALDWEPGRVQIELSTPAEALLVLAWEGKGEPRATVDGREARILPVNGVFQGIELPPDSQHVVLEARVPNRTKKGTVAGWLANETRAN